MENIFKNAYFGKAYKTKKQKKKKSEYESALKCGWFITNNPKRADYFFRVIFGKTPKASKRRKTRWNINTLHIKGLL